MIVYFDPREQIDEEGTGQPSYFSVLSVAQTGLGLRGECTGIVNTPTATNNLSFVLADDAARVAELVYARADGTGVVAFQYDRALYANLIHRAHVFGRSDSSLDLQVLDIVP